MQAAASEAVVAVAASFELGTSGGSLYQRSSLDDRHRRDRAAAVFRPLLSCCGWCDSSLDSYVCDEPQFCLNDLCTNSVVRLKKNLILIVGPPHR